MKLSRLLKKAALVLVSTVVGVVLLDGVLWLVHPLPSGQSAHFVIPTDFPGLKPQVEFDKYQDLRGLPWSQGSSLPKPAGTFRVLIVGASTTESTQQSPDDAWWGVLQKNLQERLEVAGKSVQVLAFGQGGFDVSDDLEWLNYELVELNPDLLITLAGVNDLAFPAQSHSDLPLKYRVRGFLRSVSQIYRHLSAIKLRWDISRGAKVRMISSADLKKVKEEVRGLPLSEPATRNPDPLPRFDSGVRSIIRLAQQHKIPILLLGQPVLWKDKMSEAEDAARWFQHFEGERRFWASGPWMYHEMRRFNEAQRKAARETGSCFLNLDEAVPKTLEVYYDDCHYTDAGSTKVADAVFPAVVQCLQRNSLPSQSTAENNRR